MRDARTDGQIGVRPDVRDGVTYLGLVPFRMANAGFGRRGRVPYVGDFLETNLRVGISVYSCRPGA